MKITHKQKQQYRNHIELAGFWYCNNQNTDEHPWGGISDSADKGRFVYEYVLHRNFARGMGVWGQGVAIMSLLDLAHAFPQNEKRFRQAALLGANYLKYLQVMDFRLPKSIGAFREHTPMTEQVFPRDAATGGFAYCSLFKETQDQEWLDRAKLFAEWWINHASDKDGWPYMTFNIEKQFGHNSGMDVVGEESAEYELVKGNWQAGAALFFYQLFKLTGDSKYIEKGFDPILRGLMKIYDTQMNEPMAETTHCTHPIVYGNDDFALIVLVCAYRLKREKRYLDMIVRFLGLQNQLMDADGSFPTMAGTFVSSISNLEFMKLVKAEKLDIDVSGIEKQIRKSAEFGLTIQVKTGTDLRLLGGVYGQSSYDVSTTWVHHRSVGYSINFYLRMMGVEDLRTFSSFGW